ncbi:putative amidoligase enzyme-domain-containing protein [Xylariaceae sp. FL1651]|nr:putative amidoligase enzyme-domain-containing protein [Xylariaceae sp. FL1651]
MSYFFGVEIELIAKPFVVDRPLLRRVYYEKLASSLNSHGVYAIADKLNGSYRKHPEHYGKWWITKDGSLGNPEHPLIPLEAVSPILTTGYHWEAQVDIFWCSWDRIFHTPDKSRLCGSHIHVSPFPRQQFDLIQLKCIAFGVVLFEPHLNQLLPCNRRNNKYCLANTKRSERLQTMGAGDNEELYNIWYFIWHMIRGKQDLRDFMQKGSDPSKDRYVRWNFDNILEGRSGTIEFRGGQCLRGPAETKTWISFVLAFVQLCLAQLYKYPALPVNLRPSMSCFWRDICGAAMQIGVAHNLPSDWAYMAVDTRRVRGTI